MTNRRSSASRARNVVLSVLSLVLVQTRTPAQAFTQVPSCLPVLLGCLQEEAGGETTVDPQTSLDLLRDESATFSRREHALREICTNGPEESILAALEILEAMFSALEVAPAERRSSDKTLMSNRRIIWYFMHNYIAPVQDTLNDQRPLLALMLRIASSDVPHHKTHDKAFRTIALTTAPREVRQETLLSVVERCPQKTVLHKDFYALFDASTFPKLRDIFRTAWATKEFHFLAAHILAYNGDQEIVAEMRTMIPELLDRSPKIAPYLKFDIWRIEVQQTPEALLQYIGSTEGWHARAWATERAVQKGIQKARIREAILEHVRERKAQETERKGESCAAIKRVGLHLGILQQGDLPNVPIDTARRRH